jgi:protein-S-isoprenylcysteine O-methyltransferase Ste14
MIRANTSPIPTRTPTTLVASGIYARSQNPMYLGMLALYAAAAYLLADVWGLLVLAFLVVAMDRLVVPSEERRLEHRFGGGFRRYEERVPRWL